jgi:hypothetical protein
MPGPQRYRALPEDKFDDRRSRFWFIGNAARIVAGGS